MLMNNFASLGLDVVFEAGLSVSVWCKNDLADLNVDEEVYFSLSCSDAFSFKVTLNKLTHQNSWLSFQKVQDLTMYAGMAGECGAEGSRGELAERKDRNVGVKSSSVDGAEQEQKMVNYFVGD